IFLGRLVASEGGRPRRRPEPYVARRRRVGRRLPWSLARRRRPPRQRTRSHGLRSSTRPRRRTRRVGGGLSPPVAVELALHRAEVLAGAGVAVGLASTVLDGDHPGHRLGL